jgi:altronate dehydratase
VTRALVISDRDNVATALEPIVAGTEVEVGGRRVRIREAIPAGHKFALAAIPAGADIVKYGSPIGTASAPIVPGAHVHTHNVASGRGRGDLAVRAKASVGGRVGSDDELDIERHRPADE